MDWKRFFAELKRRNVYRVAAAYAIVAWLITQVATQVFPFFEIPNSAVRLLIIALAVGFAVAVPLAWLFEFTPEGIVRTEKADRAQPVVRSGGRKLDFVIIGVLLVVVAMLVIGRRSSGPEKSIAVLPFENLSDDKENAFFADGIQDDILTSLAKIEGLRVISRTSVMNYRDVKGRNLREIGKALGAANVLEGSVRRDGNKVAINVQLIDAVRDRHLWAHRYERSLADSLGLQGELAEEIASELEATLSPEEKIRVETKPTNNADAYVLYLRARQYGSNPDNLLQNLKTAEQLFLKAIELDPKFALAHAQLAQTRAQIFHFHEPLNAWKEKARAEAEEALRLQPDLPEGHAALGLCYYWMDGDYEGALRELAVASKLAPNDSYVGVLVASIRRRQGRWEESLREFERNEKLDPQNPNIVRNLIFTNTALRRWPEAAKAAERLRKIAPDSIVAKIQAAYVDFWGKGDITALRSTLAGVSEGVDPDGVVTACRWEAAMLERNFNEAERVLKATALSHVSYMNGGPTPLSFFHGCVALARGDTNSARAGLEAARQSFEKDVKEAPEVAERHANLGLVCALLGRKEDAIREGRRAVELKPESKDAYDGAIMNCYLALIYARVGEKDLAFPLMERLLKTPGAVDSVNYSLTINDLKFRWEWDGLRKDPRFQKLIGSEQ